MKSNYTMASMEGNQGHTIKYYIRRVGQKKDLFFTSSQKKVSMIVVVVPIPPLHCTTKWCGKGAAVVPAFIYIYIDSIHTL